MARHTRKGTNPGPVDAWLDAMGYYRKNVAYDETCLFRAISEQLFSCQIYHERCRKDTVEYGRENDTEFEFLMPKEAFLNHLIQLEMHMVVCGNTEMQIISKKYKKNVIVFHGSIKQIVKITSSSYDDNLMVCLMGNDHYDVVYKKDYIQTAGFCQSIVYGLVYKNVFNISDIGNIIETMLYGKMSSLAINSECSESQMKMKVENNGNSQEKECNLNDYECMLQTNVAPFPYKIAKALDENIYRNIEYDTWTEIRKELRLGQWYYGDENLILGTCCMLRTDDEILRCYIQQIRKQEDKCVVYVTSLAEKRTVRYSDLAPEVDAKPWPLPYRFARHTNNVEVQEVKHADVNNNDKIKRNIRRRRDSKRNQNRFNPDNGPTLTLPTKTEIANNVKDFEGSPLHMHQQTPHFEQSTARALADQQSVEYYQRESPWIKAISEQVIAPRSTIGSQSIYPHVPKEVVSAVPDIMYTDVHFNAQHPQTWSTASDQLQTPQEHMPQSPQEVLVSPNPYPYYYEQVYQSPVVSVAALQPTSPYVPFYPTVFPNTAPGTPVVYTTGHEPQEVIVMTPPTTDAYARVYSPGYNPPIDMSFMSPSFVYPTPPGLYQPSLVDAQGFIFPTPITSPK